MSVLSVFFPSKMVIDIKSTPQTLSRSWQSVTEWSREMMAWSSPPTALPPRHTGGRWIQISVRSVLVHKCRRCVRHSWETARFLQAPSSASEGSSSFQLFKWAAVKQARCLEPDHTQDWECTCVFNQNRSLRRSWGSQPSELPAGRRLDKPVHRCGRQKAKANAYLAF